MNAIATATEPQVNGEENLGTMAVIEAGYRSIAERRSVPIAEIQHQ